MEKEQLERESSFECKKCARKFRTEKSYKMHMQDCYADDDKKECPKCFRQFMTEDSLTVHIESAHPDFDYNQHLLKVSKDKVNYYRMLKVGTIESGRCWVENDPYQNINETVSHRLFSPTKRDFKNL